MVITGEFWVMNVFILVFSRQNEPYDFKHLLIISRIYRLSAEEAAELQAASPRTKRQKQSAPPPAAGVFPFHPEDDIIRRVRPPILLSRARF